jgi:RND family efflux transporter MFP subunit
MNKGTTRLLKWTGMACVLVGGLAATAAWKPGLYQRWLGRGAADETSAAAERLKFASAKRADLRVAVTEEGKLRAVKSHPIFPQLRSQSRITFLAPEGATVKKGDVLVAFDKKAFEDLLLTTQTELAAAQRAFAIAQLAVDIQERTGASAVKLAETKLREAKVSLKTYEEMEGPQKLNKTETDMNEARGKLTEAQKKLAEAQRQMEDQLFTDDEQRKQVEREFNSAKETTRTLRNTVDSLGVQRKIFRAYEYPQNMENKVLALENATLEVQKATVAAKSELQQKQEEVTKQKDLIERHTRRINDLKQDIERCELRAPIDGIIIYGDPDNQRSYYRQQIKVGSEWYGSNTIMTIPDLSAFEIDFQIAEEYRGRLVEGATADITVEAVPGLRMSGKLTRISRLARPRVEYDPSSPKVFDGTVTPEKSDPRMISGMTARVEIVTDQLKGVLQVPIESVFNDEGKPVCYVRRPDGKPEKREVKPGRSNDHFVEVVDGLKEGEEVQLFVPTEGSSGAGK